MSTFKRGRLLMGSRAAAPPAVSAESAAAEFTAAEFTAAEPAAGALAIREPRPAECSAHRSPACDAEERERPAGLEMLDRCLPLFEVLKDTHRQALFVALVQGGEMTVNELAATSTLSRPTVSHHLKMLRDQGLVEVTKVGTRRVCRARAAEVLDLLRQLVGALETDLARAESRRSGPRTPPAPSS